MSASPTPSRQGPARVGEMPLASRVAVFGLREAGVGVALLLLIIVFSIVAPYFATTDNFSVILGQISHQHDPRGGHDLRHPASAASTFRSARSLR